MSHPHKRYSDAAEACYWQSRAAFWHEAADQIARDIEVAPARCRDWLVTDWLRTKNAARSAGIVARTLMGL